MRLFLWFTVVIIVLVFDYSCANRVPPTGGAKDIKAPLLLGATPQNGALNVPLDAVITLRFDEFAELQNSSAILVSPLIEKQPEFKLRGKNLIIDFQDNLRPNTTYTIFFGESLKDVNEGNILHGFDYTFSTGSTRDSLSIKGKLLSAKDNKPIKDVYLLLYDGNSADTAFLTSQPLYVTRSDEAGQYKLSNIASGNYRLFALDDKNNNYYYDQANEQIAFLDSTIQVIATAAPPPNTQDSTAAKPDSLLAQSYNTSIIAPPLRLFSEGKEPPLIAEKKMRDYGYAILIFTKAIDSLAINSLDTLLKKTDWQYEITPQNDSILLWYRNVAADIPLSFALSGAGGFADTARFKPTPALNTLPLIKYISSIRQNRGSGSFDPSKKVWLLFNAPYLQFDKSKISLIADTTQIALQNLISFDPKNPRRIQIDYAWKTNVKYILSIPDSTITDFWGQPNEAIEIRFTSQQQSQFGNIQLKCNNFDANKSYIFQLRDARGENVLLQKPLANANLFLEEIMAGSYQISIIEDRNKNGKWDTGNYLQHVQPENSYISLEAITVKGNWDTEVVISLNLSKK